MKREREVYIDHIFIHTDMDWTGITLDIGNVSTRRHRYRTREKKAEGPAQGDLQRIPTPILAWKAETKYTESSPGQ